MNLNYHISELDIKCPYCNKSCRDDGNVVAQELEKKIEFKCEHCFNNFLVESHVVFSTDSDCELNGKEHEFERSKYVRILSECKNCSKYEVY